MIGKKMWVALPLIAALAGCQMESSEFGGSGGSWQGGGSGGFGGAGGSGGGGQAGVSLARDVCTNAVRERGGIVVGVESVRELRGGAEIVMATRRSQTTLSTQRQRCTFNYATGSHSIQTI
jgi:hypothetical protein